MCLNCTDSSSASFHIDNLSFNQARCITNLTKNEKAPNVISFGNSEKKDLIIEEFIENSNSEKCYKISCQLLDENCEN